MAARQPQARFREEEASVRAARFLMRLRTHIPRAFAEVNTEWHTI
jgi:hypothetical protein